MMMGKYILPISQERVRDKKPCPLVPCPLFMGRKGVGKS